MKDVFNDYSDAQLKNILKEIGRIEDKNLDLAVQLLRKLLTSNGLKEIVMDLTDSCIGAMDPAFYLSSSPQYIAELTYLVANDIKGEKLYTLYNDCARRNDQRFLLNIWALQSGVYPKEEIETNFKITGEKNRYRVLPFVYREDIISINDYVPDLKNFNYFDKNFKEYVLANRSLFRFEEFAIEGDIKFNGIKRVAKNNIQIDLNMPEEVESSYYGTKYVQNSRSDTIEINTNQLIDIIITGNKSKHYCDMNSNDFKKVLFFLKESKNKFLPGLHIIRNFPANEIKSFYINNNDKRYGILNKKSGFVGYYEQEGLFKLAYILGLFNESEIISNNALKYLEENVLPRVSGEDIHKLYGSLNLKNGYKKDFAEFFMIHHKSDIHCFEDEEGVDRTKEIYNNFETILNARPEKEIKTSTDRKRLMPIDVINCIKDRALLLCAELGFDLKYKEDIGIIAKYTVDKDEIEWAINILEESRKIPHEKVTIPYIKDDTDSSYKFRVLEKGDPEIIITGIKTNCCFRYKDASFSSLIDAISSEDSTVVVFENDKAYSQAWVWYDRENELLVLDNIEGNIKHDDSNKDLVREMLDCVIRYADKTLIELNNRGYKCKSINLGNRYLKKSLETTLKLYEEEGLVQVCKNSIIDYPRKKGLYTDAKEQYIISSFELLKVHPKVSEEIKLSK